MKKRSAGASPVAAPMPKSVPRSLREKIDCLKGECFCVPFTDGVACYL